MRLFAVFVVLFLCGELSFYAQSIDRKIEKSKKDLAFKEKESKRVSSSLYRIADKILNEQKKVKALQEKIASLDENIKEQLSEYELKKKELKDLEDSTTKLIRTKKDLERKIIDVVLKNFAVTLISFDNKYNDSVESIITDEVFKTIANITKQEFSKIKDAYTSTMSAIQKEQKEIEKIKNYIKKLNKKKKKLKKLKSKEYKVLAALKREKQSYKNKLTAIRKEQQMIRNTLEKLNILKKERIKEAQRVKQENLLSTQSVRRIGSSYQNSKTKRYNGPKTISPLKNCIVKRKFGNYYDPVYKMRIYNESVMLKPVNNSSMVRNILDGKVVFAKDTPLLDKVIVIEHKNGIHTIYAHISKIAPTVKIGKKIKKGAIIGRVDNELSLEVTQKNYHIDPLELIRIN